MFKNLLKSFSSNSHTSVDAETVRQQLQSIFFKLKSYRKALAQDTKLNFAVIDTTSADAEHRPTGQITFFLGGYAIRYELDELKTIQLYRRGKIDNLQFCELLAISFDGRVEYIADELFVKADVYQLEILINHVIKNRNIAKRA